MAGIIVIREGEAAFEEFSNLVDDRRHKIEAAMAAEEEAQSKAHSEFWGGLKKLFPETEDGNWKVDTQYGESGVYVLSPHNVTGCEECGADHSEDETEAA